MFKIAIAGGTGYIGSFFLHYFAKQGTKIDPVEIPRDTITNEQKLSSFLKEEKPIFLINCVGHVGRPNVDSCEKEKADCLYLNAVLPAKITKVCADLELKVGHVSSGCIYSGSLIGEHGFTEEDEPNFSFRKGEASFYSGSKALGEELLEPFDNCYIWRLRMPFCNIDSDRNYISKLLRYDKLLNATNSLSESNEFVEACIHTWLEGAPTGVYNVTNTGHITTKEITRLIQKILKPKKFEFFESDNDFMREVATPRSNCILDNNKLKSVGFRMSSVEEALEKSMRSWKWELRA